MKTIPVETDEQWALNVFVGDSLIVTMADGSTQETTCRGWKFNQGEYRIKTMIEYPLGYYDAPMQDVKIIVHPREERLLEQLEATALATAPADAAEGAE